MPKVEVYEIEDTWNDGGKTFDGGVAVNITDTASASDSRLLSLSIANNPYLRFGKDRVLSHWQSDDGAGNATWVEQRFLNATTYAISPKYSGTNSEPVNIGVGRDALVGATGADLTGLGRRAVNGNTATGNILGLGLSSLEGGSGDASSAFGNLSGYQAAGDFGTYGGYRCGYQQTGSWFAGLGVECGESQSGDKFTGNGYQAGKGNTGDGCFFGGYRAGLNNIHNNVICVGDGATATAANQTVLGNASTANTRLPAGDLSVESGNLSITPTWDSLPTVFLAVDVDVVDTNSHTNSLLARLAIGGTEKAGIDKNGYYRIGGETVFQRAGTTTTVGNGSDTITNILAKLQINGNDAIDTDGTTLTLGDGGLTRVAVPSGVKLGAGTALPVSALTVAESDGTKARLIIQETSGDVGDTAELLFKTTSADGDTNAKAGVIFEDDGSSNARGILHLCNNITNNTSNASKADAALTIDGSRRIGAGRTDPTHRLDAYDGGGGNVFRAKAGVTTSDAIGTIEGTSNVDGSQPVALRVRDNQSGSWTSGATFGAVDFFSNDASGSGAGVKAAMRAYVGNVSGSTVGLKFYIDKNAGLVETMALPPNGALYLNALPTAGLQIRDAGTVGGTEAGWVEIDIDGTTLYLRGTLTK